MARHIVHSEGKEGMRNVRKACVIQERYFEDNQGSYNAMKTFGRQRRHTEGNEGIWKAREAFGQRILNWKQKRRN